MKVDRGGRAEPLPLASRARHLLHRTNRDRRPSVGVGKVVRHYSDAQSETAVGPDRTKRALAEDRRLMVAQRDRRDTALQPGRAADAGRTRPRRRTLRHALPAGALAGQGRVARRHLADSGRGGTGGVPVPRPHQAPTRRQVHGHGERAGIVRDQRHAPRAIENGATVSVKVQARGKFDLTAEAGGGRCRGTRPTTANRGPVSPAAEVRAEVTVQRVAADRGAGRVEHGRGRVAGGRQDSRRDDRPAAHRPGGQVPTDVPAGLACGGGEQQHIWCCGWSPAANWWPRRRWLEWKGTKPVTTCRRPAGEFKAASGRQPGWKAGEGDRGRDVADRRRAGRCIACWWPGRRTGCTVVQGFHLCWRPTDGRWR